MIIQGFAKCDTGGKMLLTDADTEVNKLSTREAKQYLEDFKLGYQTSINLSREICKTG